MRGSLRAVAVDPTGSHGVIVADEEVLAQGTCAELAAAMHRAEQTTGEPPRWVWWDATSAASALVASGAFLHRCWDLAEAHRLLVGGSDAAMDRIWAVAHGLDPDLAPARRSDDLFDVVDDDSVVVRPDGYLNPVCVQPHWQRDNLTEYADLALRVARKQLELLAVRERGAATGASESGAALLCVELTRHGLPIDRATMERLITQHAGPRPADAAQAGRIRTQRDRSVLDLLPGQSKIDLRNPVQVRELLRSLGVQVDDTRAWNLEPYRDTHPVVAALLDWRKDERIATTYGWQWLDAHVGRDDRLRGPWTACDGGAGRMTAGAGLHSLPTPLRPGVAAADGHVLVRADLGQVEPRVLAVVSGDPAFARATADDDLYATVARQLNLERPAAKIAVLAAMYGQTSGPAAEALRRMDRTYPQAMAYLRAAAQRGEAGEPVMTYGGRVVPVSEVDDQAHRRAVGRFTRNAVVQGAAAELFKAWALTVRNALRPLGAEVVLCLHDELLVHAPQQHAQAAAAAVHDSLQAAARRWSGGAPVRFVADLRVIHRWSEAKD